ncbi:MAG TPA: DUF1549 domain-containing protein, partial [Tepidisphaeraceae bacterium]|nr:DUF1549 domain-containing protein [Tepidisphaeraceae bacterium]
MTTSRVYRRCLGSRAAAAVAILAALMATTAGADGLGTPARVRFNRDVRPILSENCFFCHGQDPARRDSGLRLDVRDQATRDLGGYAAIVPGKPDESEMVGRLTTTSVKRKMPPAKSHRTATPAQVGLIKRWIAEGAGYERHWSFETPRRPAVPPVRRADWAKGDVDRFVLARLEADGLSPSRESTPGKWLRRASLDLTGLPPASAELDAFEAEAAARGDAAYAAAADRLLASPRFGERQAIDWLDAARYADTHGFNNDSARSMWRWRDWVIAAFNANLPYDRFITEQLAGDLLPAPTLEQRLATGFGRNHVINSEGGVIDEEYRVEYVADRVRTTSMAWLGLTLECARCHDHKFDPVSQKDYYRFFAFFNNVAEHGEDGRVANAVPMMPAPTRDQVDRLAAAERELVELDAKLRPAREAWRLAAPVAPTVPADDAAAVGQPSFAIDAEDVKPKPKAWSFPSESPGLTPGVRGRAWAMDGSGAGAKLDPAAFATDNKAGASVAFWVRADAGCAADVPLFSNQDHLGSLADGSYGKGVELRLIDGELEFRASRRYPVYGNRVRTAGANVRPGEWRHVALTIDPQPDLSAERVPASVTRVFVDGREQAVRVLNDGLPSFPAPTAWLLGADNAKEGARFRGAIDGWRAYARPLSSAEVRRVFAGDAIAYAAGRAIEGRATATEVAWVRDAALAAADPAWRDLSTRRDEVWEAHLALRRALPTAMVMAEGAEPRPAHVLLRGAYDAPGERVEPGVPDALGARWPDGAPRNRLGLARWLTRPDHPLTARVVVNRFWAQLFGTGLVKTLEDFGFQAEWPSHPELLDYLARS